MNKSRKIYFACPNNKFATGGVKHIYHQVAMLNSLGYDAYILHKKKQANATEKWLDMEVPIVYSPHLFKTIKYNYRKQSPNWFKRTYLSWLKRSSHTIEEDAILVIPELYGPHIHLVEPGLSKVIFNQNCFYTFDHFSTDYIADVHPYNAPDTLATIVASEVAKEYLNYTFPNLPIFKIRLGIDHHIFGYNQQKKKQICFMPRKLSEDVLQVINILRLHKLDQHWQFVSIDNKSEQEVANIMKESAIFLSFNHREGFGLPPAEAMATGCYVIGYCGQGGKEYMNPTFSSPIADGDITAFAKEVCRIAALYEESPSEVLKKGKLASDFIRETYSLENEKEDIGKLWTKILTDQKTL